MFVLVFVPVLVSFVPVQSPALFFFSLAGPCFRWEYRLDLPFPSLGRMFVCLGEYWLNLPFLSAVPEFSSSRVPVPAVRAVPFRFLCGQLPVVLTAVPAGRARTSCGAAFLSCDGWLPVVFTTVPADHARTSGGAVLVLGPVLSCCFYSSP